jgi:hypothetical protein
MTMLRIAMLIMCIFLGGIGVIVGGAISAGMLRSGEVSYTVPESGRTVSKTANRDRQPDEFWRVFALLGILPMVLGGAASWYGWRAINRG